jgi:hypothetical protein
MKQCLACGMPLVKKEDFALGDENSDFCLHCVNADGSVKSGEEIFNGGVEFFLGAIGGDRAMAEKITRKNMNSLPYWQGKDCVVLKGEEATDEEFQAAMAKL